MIIYCVRHSNAEPADPVRYPDDSDRPLSKEGEQKFKKAMKTFARLDENITTVLTSPYLRAQQTARILSGALKNHPPIIECPELKPGVNIDKLLTRLIELDNTVDSAALVGHAPDMGEITGQLIGGDIDLNISYKKGSIGKIEILEFIPVIKASLCWLINQKHLIR